MARDNSVVACTHNWSFRSQKSRFSKQGAAVKLFCRHVIFEIEKKCISSVVLLRSNDFAQLTDTARIVCDERSVPSINSSSDMRATGLLLSSGAGSR